MGVWRADGLTLLANGVCIGWLLGATGGRAIELQETHIHTHNVVSDESERPFAVSLDTHPLVVLRPAFPPMMFALMDALLAACTSSPNSCWNRCSGISRTSLGSLQISIFSFVWMDVASLVASSTISWHLASTAQSHQ